jgi:hypothetical protein
MCYFSERCAPGFNFCLPKNSIILACEISYKIGDKIIVESVGKFFGSSIPIATFSNRFDCRPKNSSCSILDPCGLDVYFISCHFTSCLYEILLTLHFTLQKSTIQILWYVLIMHLKSMLQMLCHSKKNVKFQTKNGVKFLLK